MVEIAPGNYERERPALTISQTKGRIKAPIINPGKENQNSRNNFPNQILPGQMFLDWLMFLKIWITDWPNVRDTTKGPRQEPMEDNGGSLCPEVDGERLERNKIESWWE